MIQILHNGKVYTQVKERIHVTALAILNGRVIACGSDDEILTQFKQNAVITNLEQRTILPGLTDAHIHLSLYALNLQRVNCETNTMQECLDKVQEKGKLISPGKWLLGHGWNQNSWGNRFGNKELLDAIDNQHPIYLTAKSLHAGWANSKALQMAGISPATLNPEGGIIQRDSRGEPTGILFESAMDLVASVIPKPSETDLTNAISHAQDQLNRYGITGIHDFDSMDCFNSLENLLEDDQLNLRVIKNIPFEFLDEALRLSIHSGFGDPLLKFGAVKLFADGALGPKTASMLKPYESPTDDYGMLLLSEDEILEIGIKALAGKLPLAIHAIGDRANREVINALVKLIQLGMTGSKKSVRHRIEHLQVIAPSDLELLRGSGIIASMQPIHMISDQKMADRNWGKRSEFSYAWKSIADTGTILAFGSDAPVESPNPFAAIYAAVTRLPNGLSDPDGWYPEQRITLEEALLGYTEGPAYATNQEYFVGKLVDGYFADLIVFEEDPYLIPQQRLPELRTSATMVAGKWVVKGF
jgi:predicted amidohydrolase YtcJ